MAVLMAELLLRAQGTRTWVRAAGVFTFRAATFMVLHSTFKGTVPAGTTWTTPGSTEAPAGQTVYGAMVIVLVALHERMTSDSPHTLVIPGGLTEGTLQDGWGEAPQAMTLRDTEPLVYLLRR